MKRLQLSGVLVGPAFLLIVVLPLRAQVPVVIEGRVQDASTRQPVEGARVFSADSASAALTDSLGAFTIRLPVGDSLILHVERIGYRSQHFELPDESRNRVSILLLERAPVELPEVSVVGETVAAAVVELDHNLESRRNGYPGPMRAFDRAWLDRFAPIGSVFDLVRQRDPRIYPCNSDPSQMCVPGRGPTPSNPYPTMRYSVCIDGSASLAPMEDLASLPLESVALVELFYKSQVRVYTRDYMLYRARTGRTHVPPLIMGC